MKRRFLAILAILVGSVSIVTYAQCRQESYVCDEPEVTIVEPKKNNRRRVLCAVCRSNTI